MTRKVSVHPLIYVLLIICASCSPKNRNNSGAVWGTTYHISYTSTVDLGDSIIAVMSRINDELSMFDKNSTVSKVNRNETSHVSDDFIRVFNLSKRISSLSGAAFDPTVGPLTELWGFGTVKEDTFAMPDDQQLAKALLSVGISDCHIVGSDIVKKHPHTRFDFSSVAKGYGVDMIAEMLRRNGCNDYLVEIGGEIVVQGHSPSGKDWVIQIDAPVESTHKSMYIITMHDAAIATSGNYRNYRDTPEGKIGHTLDPRTGRPVDGLTLSATVIAPDCATADALATACMVMQPDSALRMIENLPDNIEVLLAVAEADSLSIVRSSGFPGAL